MTGKCHRTITRAESHDWLSVGDMQSLLKNSENEDLTTLNDVDTGLAESISRSAYVQWDFLLCFASNSYYYCIKSVTQQMNIHKCIERKRREIQKYSFRFRSLG